MTKFSRKKFISNIKRVVLKIGSSILTDNEGNLFEPRFGQLATQIVELRKKGLEVIVVSSGAIASGMKKLNLSIKPSEIHIKQAIAACGQSSLIWNYEKAFSEFGVNVAQILLTHDGLADRKRFLNARKTIHQLLEMNIIPIVNENDSVAVEEIMIGDNDNLASLVTSLTEAELMVLLTNIDGIYKEDPKRNSNAEFISLVEVIDNNLEKLAGDTTGNTTTGGMITKIEAIKKASVFGVPSIISNGETAGVLQKIFNGEEIGTLVLPSQEKLSARKHWIAFNLQVAGEIVVDKGARDAIATKGKSLLPSGIKAVKGNFGIGDSILCVPMKMAAKLQEVLHHTAQMK